VIFSVIEKVFCFLTIWDLNAFSLKPKIANLAQFLKY
jgi:hypothetical protein